MAEADFFITVVVMLFESTADVIDFESTADTADTKDTVRTVVLHKFEITMDTVTFKETVDARMSDADCIRTDAGCGSISNAESSYSSG